MIVKQALKQKNKLVADIKECYEIVNKHNSIEEGNKRRYSVVEKLGEASELTKQLIELKTKLHTANQPVFDKIFAMAEYKGMIKQLKRISVEEGKITERYGSTQSIKEVEINITDRDKMVKLLEADIEKLQDELDFHNTTTNI
jgi:rRNA maturation endonuclease Nob1